MKHEDIDHTGVTGVGGSVATDTIWNAAGDLAVGTGSDTAARLAIGANTYVLTSNGTTASWAVPGGSGGDGIAGDGPIAPSGGDDDEFDTPDASDPMTGWTTLGTPTAHDIDTTAVSRYYVKQAAGGSGWVGIYKAVPSMPFTVTALLSGTSAQAVYAAAGLFIGESTPGKMEVLAWTKANQPDGPNLEYFTNPTTYAGTTGNTFQYRPRKMFFKMVVASSTDVSYYVSEDGFTWMLITASRNPGFTVAKVGLCVKAENGTYAVEAVFDWIRFV